MPKKTNLDIATEIAEGNKRSMRTLKNRAEKGEIDALYHLSMCQLRGFIEYENLRDVLKNIKTACVHKHNDARLALGCIYYNASFSQNGMQKRGVKLMQLAAQDGHAGSLANLAVLYSKKEPGLGLKHNPEKAWEYASLATKKGNTLGRVAKAYCLFSGIGTASNKEVAIQEMEELAKADVLPALSFLGAYYTSSNGKGKVSHAHVDNILTRAANKGCPQSCRKLAERLRTAMEPNFYQACVYYKLGNHPMPDTLNSWLMKGGASLNAQITKEVCKLAQRKEVLFCA